MAARQRPFENPTRPEPPQPHGRHPATERLLRWFAYGHLREGDPRDTSEACYTLAHRMAGQLPDGDELRAGLRQLLAAKDWFVRAAIDGEE
jgi:hypothetical protein